MIAHYVRLERCPSEQTQTGLASQTPMAYIKGVDADAEALWTSEIRNSDVRLSCCHHAMVTTHEISSDHLANLDALCARDFFAS